jgi:hypothetical protein
MVVLKFLVLADFVALLPRPVINHWATKQRPINQAIEAIFSRIYPASFYRTTIYRRLRPVTMAATENDRTSKI